MAGFILLSSCPAEKILRNCQSSHRGLGSLGGGDNDLNVERKNSLRSDRLNFLNDWNLPLRYETSTK